MRQSLIQLAKPSASYARLFAVGKPPDDLAIGFAIVGVFDGRILKVKDNRKLAVAIKTGIIQIIIAKARKACSFIYIFEPFARVASKRRRRPVSFLSDFEPCARGKGRAIEVFEKKIAKRYSIYPVARIFDELHQTLVFARPARRRNGRFVNPTASPPGRGDAIILRFIRAAPLRFDNQHRSSYAE